MRMNFEQFRTLTQREILLHMSPTIAKMAKSKMLW